MLKLDWCWLLVMKENVLGWWLTIVWTGHTMRDPWLTFREHFSKYLDFVLDTDGVPCIGRFLRVSGTSDGVFLHFHSWQARIGRPASRGGGGGRNLARGSARGALDWREASLVVFDDSVSRTQRHSSSFPTNCIRRVRSYFLLFILRKMPVYLHQI